MRLSVQGTRKTGKIREWESCVLSGKQCTDLFISNKDFMLQYLTKKERKEDGAIDLIISINKWWFKQGGGEREIIIRKRRKEQTLVSSMTAARMLVFCMAILRLFKVSWWYSWVPWEKLKRATFMPALRSFSSMGTDREEGPRVQTILVLGTRPSSSSWCSFRSPSMSMLAI